MNFNKTKGSPAKKNPGSRRHFPKICGITVTPWTSKIIGG